MAVGFGFDMESRLFKLAAMYPNEYNRWISMCMDIEEYIQLYDKTRRKICRYALQERTMDVVYRLDNEFMNILESINKNFRSWSLTSCKNIKSQQRRSMDNGEFYIYKMIGYDAMMDLVHKLFYCQQKLFDEVRDDMKQAPVKKDVSSWKRCYEDMGDFILQTPSFLQYHQHHAGLMYDTTEGCKQEQQNIITTEYLQRSLPQQGVGNNDRSRVSSEGVIYEEDQEKKGWLPSIFKRGGKYVASGTYGCVFSPPVK